MGTVVELEGISKAFGSLRAVDDLSLGLDEGEALGVVGPNGAGKTTMLSLIAGSLRPDRGRVLFCGRDVTRVPAHGHCRLGIARTFQIPRPFRRLTVLENVAVAAYYGQAGRVSRERAWAQAEEALDLVQLAYAHDARVDGLGAAGLKKLELARALATQPKLLLADESLGGLDEHEMDQAADMLARIRKERGVTIIWVEHIMGVLMRVVDRCIVLDHGEKIAEGLPREVAADPKVIEVYLGTDAAAVQAQVAARS